MSWGGPALGASAKGSPPVRALKPCVSCWHISAIESSFSWASGIVPPTALGGQKRNKRVKFKVYDKPRGMNNLDRLPIYI